MQSGGRWPPLVLPLLGSNQDSPDPESGVLPVTPRGSLVAKLPRRRSCTALAVRPSNQCTKLRHFRVTSLKNQSRLKLQASRWEPSFTTLPSAQLGNQS